MAHVHFIEDDGGDLVDLVHFCSDWCHRDWCQETGTTYEGWNGCHEIYRPEWCATCRDGLTYWDEEDRTTYTPDSWEKVAR